MYRIVIGIDPGKSGGIVAIDIKTRKVVLVAKTPIIDDENHDYQEDGEADESGHLQLLSPFTDMDPFAVIEKVTGRYGDAAHSAFQFGSTVGVARCALTACYIPYKRVHPKTWLKYYGMSKDSKESDTQWKNRLKDKARSLYPDANITLWSADAILIAHYCLMVLVK